MSTHIVKQIVNCGFVIAKMIIFIAVYFSVHILVKTLIPSELYCCSNRHFQLNLILILISDNGLLIIFLRGLYQR